MTIPKLYSSMTPKQLSSIEGLMDLDLSEDETEFKMMTSIFKKKQWKIVYEGKKKKLTSTHLLFLNKKIFLLIMNE